MTGGDSGHSAPRRSLARTAYAAAFTAMYAAVVVVSLIPSKALPQLNLSDKIEHLLAYAVLAALGDIAFPNRRRVLAVGLLATGVGLEFLQGAMGLRRQAEVLDALANGLGVAAGLGFSTLLHRLVRSRV